MKLDPKELVVTSFETRDDVLQPVTDPIDPNDPTPATHCFVCPVETEERCW